MDIEGLFGKASSLQDAIGSVANGNARTDAKSPIGLVGRSGIRYSPGFTPNDFYNVGNQTANISPGYSNDSWYGVLLDKHPDYSGEFNNNYQYLSTSDRFDATTGSIKYKIDYGVPLSTRDNYLIFGDSSSDYFRHGLHVIDEKTPLRSEKNSRETWDGSELGIPLRLAQFKTTPYENNDPVMFGFEIIIDAVSSPLLNGSVEDFIDQFSKITEVAERRDVIADFKQQFIKLFKTNGSVKIDTPSKKTASIVTSNYSNSEPQTDLFTPGKKAYMSYYLKKVQGLEFLIESNQPDKKKYLVDYRKDTIKLSFNEDVSLTIGTLSYLYKLLYWSRPMGKNIIPENLLRFNCDIVISEVRNYNRVRKSINTGDLEVLKDNLSRYVYSLKECQLWFDQASHDNEVDLAGIKEYDTNVVTMDFKYSTTKFERWTPDASGFGQYTSYNNGAIWKIGNPGARNTGSQSTTGAAGSVPLFFTTGSNSLKGNGVSNPFVRERYNTSVIGDKVYVDDGSDFDGGATTQSEEFAKFKKSSLDGAKKLAKDLQTAGINELNDQVNLRLKLLNNTLSKIRNGVPVQSGRIMSDPTNIYHPYYHHPPNFFFDVQNSLKDFLGDAIGNILGK